MFPSQNVTFGAKSYKVLKNWSHKSVLKLIEETGNDPETEIRERARQIVLKAMENGWSGPPYDAIELAKFLKIEIVPNDSLLDARIIPQSSKKFKIEYNPFQKPTRINFSIAHEIAHTFFSDCSQQVRNRESYPGSDRELEMLCNVGASEIQLPYGVFSNDANSIERISLESLVELATKYRASLESLFIRFTEVITKECAIVICSFKDSKTLVVDYYKKSESFTASIPENFVIPNDSKAYECTTPGWSSRETTHWSFLSNEHEVYCVGISPLRKDNRGRVGIIITRKYDDGKLQDQKIIMEYGDATKPRGEGKKIIVQVVNTSGGLGLGFGKSLSKNYPIIKSELTRWSQDKEDFILGNSQLIRVSEDIFVYQMLAQKGLYQKKDEIPLKYDALRKCLSELRGVAAENNASIHMPFIGAGQAKGDWQVIQGIIFDELVHRDINVKIYMLPGKVQSFKTKSHLTLFNEQSTWLKEK